ncbi:RidA family protein [Actinomadura roseirufa]|uniref:RidA family protein n=1 Tax=Actinomadura roseirufa TaxID=2094049 RepID=UPI001041A43D|nr:Rid family detoxifying hydrolase [Actinomadura roseirufa]
MPSTAESPAAGSAAGGPAKEIVTSAAGAPPAGAYSPAVRAGDFVYISGQGPLDPATGEIVPGDVAAQTELTLANLAALARAAGGSLADAVKVNVYLADIADFAAFNAVYAAAVPEPRPARTTVAAGLNGILVEIDAVLHLPREGGS